MKKVLFFFSILSFCTFTTKAQENFQVNTQISSIEWIGKKVTGQHEGVIEVKKGNYTFENGLITEGVITINMKTIKITDIEDEEQNEKLQTHLISPDFFSVEKFPTSTLTIQRSEKISDDKLRVYGILEIKGNTERVNFEVTLLKEGKKMVAVGELEVDRTKYDIRYGSGSFFDNLGDKAIKDFFTIKFKVAAIQR